mgnify:CR=1 FL=1
MIEQPAVAGSGEFPQVLQEPVGFQGDFDGDVGVSGHRQAV